MTLPDVTYSEDLFTFNWPDAGIQAIVERFQESKEDIRAELTITSSHPTLGGQLYFGRLLLMGPRSRAEVRNALEKRDSAPDWGGMLEQIVTVSLRRYREGAPAVDLWDANLGSNNRYLVRPFLFDDAVNIVYGSGDSGKSLFSLMLALAVASGEEVAGLVPERSGPVLYLDWEDSPSTHQERLRGLQASMNVPMGAGRIIYRRMDASLTESAREVRKDIASIGAAMVIVDSLGMACGGDPSDAGGIIRTMLAARSLGIPVLAIHHIAKDAKDKSTPYGSVYASNEARMSWLVESERDDGFLNMVLTNHKANRGQHHDRQSYKFVFTENDREEIIGIEVSATSFATSKKVGDGGVRYQIESMLRANGKLSVSDIAIRLDKTSSNITTVLKRSEGTMFNKEIVNGIGMWSSLAVGYSDDETRQEKTPENLFPPQDKTRGDSLESLCLPENEIEKSNPLFEESVF